VQSPVTNVPASAGPLRSSLFGLLPALAVLLLLMLLGLLLWMFEREERDTQRQSLIRDALWVEQSLQFHFATQHTWFVNLAKDIVREGWSPLRFRVVAERYQASHPEILSMVWRNADGVIIAKSPSDVATAGKVSDPQVSLERLSMRTGSAAYINPVIRPDGVGVMALVAPLPHGTQVLPVASPPVSPADAPGEGLMYAGTLVVSYALDKALAEHAPWWIAEKRAVVLRDGRGDELARRSQVMTVPGAPAYTIAVGPPLPGLTLTLTTFNDPSSFAQNSVIAAMVGLGLVAVGGLVARERALRRRETSETALRDETAFRKAMEDSLTIGMRARDLNGRITYVNHAFCHMTGWTLEELLGQGPPQPYWLAEDMERTRRVHDKVLRGDGPDDGFELTFQRKDGSRFDALVYEAPLIDATGRQRGWMGSFIDVTDRRRTEATARAQAERLHQTARLVTLGEMASLLAHDLNQPLAAISGYAAGLINHLENGAPSADDLKPALERLGAEAERAGAIIRRVRDFAKRSEPHRLAVDLMDMTRDAGAALQSEIHSAGIDFTLKGDPGPAQPLGDRVLLEQVVVNLVRNAIEALASTPTGLRHIEIELGATKTSVEFSVRDNGHGVANDMRPILFNAFSSGKSNGMGMGLTICRSILELHGGGIVHEDAPGGGSIFTCRLPTGGQL
jgi:two-component system, LuxR family, sensor histidine kinase DctS